MDSITARLHTFENADSVQAQEFARCGLYKTSGSANEVCCVYCAVKTQLDMSDDPLKAHSELCPIVVKLKETRPHNTKYKTISARLSTFDDWPKGLTQTPEELAEAGFYYTGAGDKVKCFYCDGGLRDWQPYDDPWQQHAGWFNRCFYVNTVKGSEYVKMAAECVTQDNNCVRQKNSIEKQDNDIDEKNHNDNNLCKICLVEQANVCLIPCGHIVACVKCAFSINPTCPMCRKPFATFIRVYFS
ncbi:IAP-3 [Mocis latipes granulovirus]|uniref:IAP-3 n=1 Tax=Mocis latipes granulovirus TaxID=2072024 RepID=A0A162GX07_9BBAC|nr:IAP-3 [Mocis latipes granulovirus]AKR17527.1 IAP-3 [Mocis latipes granulovirus]